jgi:hypothetical protein
VQFERLKTSAQVYIWLSIYGGKHGAGKNERTSAICDNKDLSSGLYMVVYIWGKTWKWKA